MSRMIMIILGFSFVSCSSGGGGSAVASKDLFSAWTLSTNSATVLNFAGAAFNTSEPYNFFTTSANQCHCTLYITGSQTAGTYAFSGCTYVASTGTGSDPGCATLNDNGTFTNAAAVLHACSVPASTCSDYH